MKVFLRILCCLFGFTAYVLADGGVLLGRWDSSDAVLFLFAKESKLRAGPVELEVLAQDPKTSQPLLEGRVEVRVLRSDVTVATGEEWLPPCCRTKLPDSDQWEFTAMRPSLGNRLFYQAETIFQKPGKYHVSLDFIDAKRLALAELDLEISEPLPPWRTYWPMFALPFFALGLFVVNRRIGRRV